MNRTTHLLAVWCGPAFTVLVAIGLVVLADFFPPPAPSSSAEQIASMYQDNLGGIRAGMVVTLIGMALILPWGTVVAAHLRGDGSSPVLFSIQVASAAIATVLALLVPIVWATAAFRPDEVGAEAIRMVNDLGWFLFAFPWTPFSVWLAAVSLAILSNGKSQYPRWLGYFSLWLTLLFATASLVIVFKTGPFAWNGLLGLYVPLTAFFTWLIIMTAFTIRSIRRMAD